MSKLYNVILDKVTKQNIVLFSQKKKKDNESETVFLSRLSKEFTTVQKEQDKQNISKRT